jgi:hypothetical protein
LFKIRLGSGAVPFSEGDVPRRNRTAEAVESPDIRFG